MCNFLSGVITIEKHPKILCCDLLHHENTIAKLKLKPETYREWEWTQEDFGESLTIRHLPEEDENEFKSAILALYPRRIDCLNECIKQVVRNGGNLYLNRLTSAEGLNLPENVGGNLCLNGLTSAEGLNLPENIGGSLCLRSLTYIKNLQLRNTIIHWKT